jgi:hypothetical protein
MKSPVTEDMDIRKINLEHALYLAAFLLALAVRFVNLGAMALPDAEANWALQALQLAHSGPLKATFAWGPQPGYLILTGVTFALFGAGNGLARLWPALVGSLLVLMPFFFRRDLGKPAALVLAFGLALDPGLAAVSRQAGGSMLALTFVLLALGAWRVRQPILAGVCAALALLGGPSILLGVLGLALAWGAALLLGRAFGWQPDSVDEEMLSSESSTAGHPWRAALIAGGVAILLISTFFMYAPQGLGAWIDTLPAFISGWINPSGIPAGRLLAGLFLYQPLAVIFGVVGVLRGWRDQARWEIERDTDISPRFRATFLLLWAVFALLIGLVYPARQMADLVWVLAPMWALAALGLASFLPKGQVNLISLGQAAIIFLILTLFWLTLSGLGRSLPGTSANAVRIGVLAGILALGVLATVLVALGWSWEVSRQGLVWGVGAALGVYGLSVLFGATLVRPTQPQEIWSLPPAVNETDIFMQTIGDLSEWTTGFRQNIDVVASVNTPSLRWALRDFPNARFVSEPPVSEMPSVIITRQDQQAPTLSASYRGQDFAWWTFPGWSGALPQEFIPWLTFREGPTQDQQVILWARSDLFPGGASQPAITEPGNP